MPKTPLEIIQGEAQGIVRLRGALDLAHLAKAKRWLKQYENLKVIDADGISKLDTAGALLLQQFARKGADIRGLDTRYALLYERVTTTEYKVIKKPDPIGAFPAMLIHLGQGAHNAWKAARELVLFLGQSSVAMGRAFSHPRRMRVPEIMHHVEQIGINAIPIISLIAFLISVVIAYQSAEQLRPLGAQQFTVNLITISVLREMGVLLTAIMVAGRSGSAFTAEIGVMKIREEVDALKAMGVDPFELLVVPRLIALIVTLPILTFIADIMGLLGGAILSKLLIGISIEQYIDRMHTVAANGKALFVGMVKAPVFAFTIGLVGCMHGMKVSGSSESVGTETTISVVQSIFLVLALDALFSIFFQKVGI